MVKLIVQCAGLVSSRGRLEVSKRQTNRKLTEGDEGAKAAAPRTDESNTISFIINPGNEKK